MKYLFKVLGSGFVLVGAIVATPSSTGLQAQENQLEEIVVTARYRAESVQDIGASISALGSDQIRSLGLSTLGDLAAFVPGLNLADRGPGRNDVNVRGIGRVIGFQDLAPVPQSVGVYYDDVPVNITAGAQLDVLFFDIEHVEVLRGPQGTLYGESSTGGTILYKGADPVLSEFSGRVEAEVVTISGGGTAFGVRGVLNIPLAEDKVALRLLVNRHALDGFIDNATFGVADLNDFETHHFKATLMAEPSDKFRIRLSGIYEDRNGGSPWLIAGDPSDKEFRTFDNLNDFIDQEYSLFSFRADYDFGNLDLQWITGYFERSIDRELHDSVPAAFVSSITVPVLGVVADGTSVDETDYEQFTQEIRLVSQNDGPFNFTLGGFYKNYDQIITGWATSDALLLLGLPTNFVYNVYVYDSAGEQYSGFGEVYYQANDRLRLTAGVRYHDETIDIFSPPNDFASFGLTLPSIDSQVKVSKWLPKASIEFFPNENALLFASVSSGIRNGNTNFTSTLGFAQLFGIDVSGKEAYGDDEVIAYEIGAKMTLMDNRMTLNGAVFYNDWKDLQVQVAQATLSLIENVGSAHTLGVELEANVIVSDQLSLFFLGNWTEAETDEDFIINLDTSPPGIAPKGTRIPYTPKYTFATGMQFTTAISDNAQLSFRGTFRYTGDYVTTFPETVELGDFGILDLSAALEFGNWVATLRLDNALDKNEIVSFAEFNNFLAGGNVPPGVDFNELYINRPRTVSLNLAYRF